MNIEELLERLIEDGCYTLDNDDSVPLVAGEIPPVKEESHDEN